MSELRKAAQQALEYLDAPSAKLWPAGEQHRIITAIRAALAQPEPEPVRRVQKQFMDEEVFYTAPPQRKPLTDEDIKGIVDVGLQTWTLGESTYEFARAIERAHGID